MKNKIEYEDVLFSFFIALFILLIFTQIFI